MRMTKDEITLVVVVLLVFVAGTAAKHYRNTHSSLRHATPSTPQPTSSAGNAPSEHGTPATPPGCD